MEQMVMKTVLIEDKTGKENQHDKGLIFVVFLCFAAGFFAPVLGLVFAIVHSILTNDTTFNRLSTILFVAAFPLLFAGSHLLDVERDRRKKRRREYLENFINF